MAAADLNSPSQVERDKAAALLRRSYVPPPRSNWNAILTFVRTNRDAAETLRRLRWFPHTSEPEGERVRERYRLDSAWELTCSYRTNDNTREGFSIHLHHCWVQPPSRFTGTWVTYYVNGQKCEELTYRNGELESELEYEENGSKWWGTFYHSRGPVYEQDIMYDSFGRTSARWDMGTNGTVIMHNEAGSVLTNWHKNRLNP